MHSPRNFTANNSGSDVDAIFKMTHTCATCLWQHSWPKRHDNQSNKPSQSQ